MSNFNQNHWPNGQRGRRRLPVAAARWITLTGLVAATAWAQTSRPAVDVKVTETAGSDQVVRVMVDKTVLLNFSAPIDEVRVVNDGIAEATVLSPYQLMVTGKSVGNTRMLVRVKDNGQKVFDLTVQLDLAQLTASIRAAEPRAAVQVQSMVNSVVLTGTAPDAEAAAKIAEIAAVYSERIVNHIQVAGTPQVLLRCTVAEVNRTATRALGFNGWIGGKNMPSMFANSNLGGINPTSIAAAPGMIVSGPQALGNTTEAAKAGIIPFTISGTGAPFNDATTLSLGFPEIPMQFFIHALRESGLLRVLAEPDLTALSGQEARFLAGGKFPIPVAQGNQQVTIQFEEFGIELVFTPTVLNEGRIRLHVAPKISEPDLSTAVQIQGFFVPGVSERSLDTVVEVGSGQTFALGGLLSDKVRATSQKIPGLGDIPVLGALFTSVDYQHDETELVILVTPELVSGLAPQQVTSLPGATSTEPNDFELFLLGKVEGASTAGPKLMPCVNRVWQAQSNPAFGDAAAMKLRGPVGPAGSEEGQ